MNHRKYDKKIGEKLFFITWEILTINTFNNFWTETPKKATVLRLTLYLYYNQTPNSKSLFGKTSSGYLIAYKLIAYSLQAINYL